MGALPSVVGGAAQALPTPAFIADEVPIKQSVPYLTLAWGIPDEDQPDPNLHFEVEVASSADFDGSRIHYRGPDMSSFISGLAEGDYFYRLRTYREEGAAGAWSEPIHVIIAYDSLTKAFLLFGIGAVVSVATVALVVVGDRRTRREEETAS